MARPSRPVNARFAATLIFLSLLGGCTWINDRIGPPSVERGNRVDPEKLAQITPGVQTRSDVEALLGSPTARGTFDEDHWYYISSRTRTSPGRFLEVEDRRVVAIAFTPQGVVSDIRELTGADGRDVRIVSRETPVPGTDRTLLQALFGNIGRPGLDRGTQSPTRLPGASTAR